MKQYLLNIYQPDGPAPAADVLEPIMRELNILNEEIKNAGAFVSTYGLDPASAATVVRIKDCEALTIDGPFTEGKEHVGGFWIVACPDLDAALGWAGKAARVTTLPIEVRPIFGHEAP